MCIAKFRKEKLVNNMTFYPRFLISVLKKVFYVGKEFLGYRDVFY